MIFVIDTTAFAAAMRFEPDMINFLSGHEPREIATVPPVVAEIEYGIRRIDPGTSKGALLRARADALLGRIAVLEWDARASRLFGEMKTALENTETPIDDFDAAVAAIAKSHGATVITANLVHFSRIPGIACRHWKG